MSRARKYGTQSHTPSTDSKPNKIFPLASVEVLYLHLWVRLIMFYILCTLT